MGCTYLAGMHDECQADVHRQQATLEGGASWWRWCGVDDAQKCNDNKQSTCKCLQPVTFLIHVKNRQKGKEDTCRAP